MNYTIDDGIFQAIKTVAQYLYEDEKHHWQEEGEPGEHIFHAVRLLDEFVKNAKANSEEVEEEVRCKHGVLLKYDDCLNCDKEELESTN